MKLQNTEYAWKLEANVYTLIHDHLALIPFIHGPLMIPLETI